MARTLFLDFRQESDLGVVMKEPRIYRAERIGNKVVSDPVLTAIAPGDFGNAHVLFATHGFNVNRIKGIGSLGALERELALGPSFLFIGVLWPGDWHLPVINYPLEGDDASSCGRRLAVFAQKSLPAASSVSFLSHSLGGRVVLQAIKGLKDDARPVREVCLAAPAVDRACLGPGKVFEASRLKAGRTTVLASKADEALGAVYSAGSLAASVLGDDHPFGGALGRDGPRPELAKVLTCRFPDNKHGDYFPLATGQTSADSLASIRIMIAALTGQPVPAKP